MQVESEDVVFALETIVENFGSEMAPFAVGLCQHLSQAYWRLQVGHLNSFSCLCCPRGGLPSQDLSSLLPFRCSTLIISSNKHHLAPLMCIVGVTSALVLV